MVCSICKLPGHNRRSCWVTDLKNAIQKFMTNLVGVIVILFWLYDMWNAFLHWLSNLWTALVNTIVNLCAMLYATIVGTILHIFSTILQLFSTLLETILQLPSTLLQTLYAIFWSMVDHQLLAPVVLILFAHMLIPHSRELLATQMSTQTADDDDEDNNKRLCNVCWDNPKEAMFERCNH